MAWGRPLKKEMKKPLSDRYLMILWRKAVLKANGNKCFFCGNPTIDELEAHHIIRRRECWLLRWDWRNGIPVCKIRKPFIAYEWKGTCHEYAKSKCGEDNIRQWFPHWGYLCDRENIKYKDYLVQNGMTTAEFREMVAKELKEKINDN